VPVRAAQDMLPSYRSTGGMGTLILVPHSVQNSPSWSALTDELHFEHRISTLTKALSQNGYSSGCFSIRLRSSLDSVFLMTSLRERRPCPIGPPPTKPPKDLMLLLVLLRSAMSQRVVPFLHAFLTHREPRQDEPSPLAGQAWKSYNPHKTKFLTLG
jgi:hypothetical protein